MFFLNLYLVSCVQEDVSRNTAFFKDTKAYALAKAVEKGDIETIEKLVKKDTTLLELSNPVSGSNVLILCLYVEQFESFKKLLELGANPNFINPYDNYSVLIDAIKPFGSQFEWRKENQYAELLLEYGAEPNYVVENDFTNKKGRHISATSPLMEASDLYLDMVKLLINKGADPYRELGQERRTPFSKAVRSGKFDIIYYYTDSLNVDVHLPMSVVVKQPNNEKVTYYIQDYTVNKFTLAKLKENSVELDKLKNENEGIEEANQERWKFIQYLESKGVDFKNYEYK